MAVYNPPGGYTNTPGPAQRQAPWLQPRPSMGNPYGGGGGPAAGTGMDMSTNPLLAWFRRQRPPQQQPPIPAPAPSGGGFDWLGTLRQMGGR